LELQPTTFAPLMIENRVSRAANRALFPDLDRP
jgi:hypothetical protein